MSTPKKILLVDDDQAFVESNKELLEAFGYEVLSAFDGETGLEVAQKEIPDLMVLDVMMTHETEGFEIAKRIRAVPALDHLKILLVSGITRKLNLAFDLTPDRNWLPVDRVLEKPIDPARFIAEVEKLLNG